MITLDELSDKLVSLITKKRTRGTNDITQSYTKQEIDGIVSEIVAIITSSTTDDYYNKAYIDSRILEIRNIISTLDIDVYDTVTVDTLINTCITTLNNKIDILNTNSYVDNNTVNSLVSDISITVDNMDTYKKSQFDSMITNLLKKSDLDTTGAISTSVANAMNNELLACQNSYNTHLNNICTILTGKGINTPQNSSITTIATNILKLGAEPGNEEINKEYSLQSIINIEDPDYVICSDNLARVYIANSTTVKQYTFDGNVIWSYDSVSRKTGIAAMYISSDVYILYTDDNATYFHVLLSDGTLHKTTATTISSYSNIHGIYFTDRQYTDTDFNFNERVILLTDANIFEASFSRITSTSTTSLDIYALNSGTSSGCNMKLLAPIIYYSNKLTTLYGIRNVVTLEISQVTNIYNLIYVESNNLYLVADNKLCVLTPTMNIDDILYTNDADIIYSCTDNNLVYMIDSNNKMIIYSTSSGKSKNINLEDNNIKGMYVDSLNRVIVYSDTNVYYLTKTE